MYKQNKPEKLMVAYKQSESQKQEKEKWESKLVIANKKIQSQNEEKEKLSAELIIAKKEIFFQNEEKEKRADELVIANDERRFENKEKEKRAAELVIANKELAFQNEEKEKRADELVIANHELLLQNEEKETQAAATKELESFSYSVSHDLRSPLRAINGFTQILVEDYLEKLDNEGKDILQEIIANSKKMGELIDNLLEFSRVGKQHIAITNVSISQLADTIISELKKSEPKRIFNITIKHLENINGDRNMLKQVFINMISNAFKYTGRKEEAIIEIGSYNEDEHWIYYVKDNGAGFDMKYYDKLFGVFQRLHSSNEFEGTGVGLAIIKKIITKHQGKVWAEGEVGKGACFYISLPDLQNR